MYTNTATEAVFNAPYDLTFFFYFAVRSLAFHFPVIPNTDSIFFSLTERNILGECELQWRP